ncbi:Histone H4 [Colletotrichum sp. SAR11_59]|uniref:Histone H4 n=1 Tax=Colletotrichum asianum TaxID=702518 RepID=A0A8H3WNH5_9PEZI|nr:Histone H4 [Colletotrichum siamense]KAF0330109.1 histone H4 [Colletotrichum asianum]KAI8289214.1 Histone H4 [Colletotrichum sp. SAR11_240]KAI8296616.1 Histone H4 [Colletotrichum sp. SAR11_59]KAF4823611.1 Histone H4 [Colletotrichum siamense]KAF4874860.1 Histone H4 [Colletotrichum siamense]
MPPMPASRGGPGGGKKGTGKVSGGKVLPGQGAKRHRKIMKDTIRGITKPAIRRLARRGGVKRISAMIYDDARSALKDRLTGIIRDCITYVEYRGAKTITIHDVIHSLRRLGAPIYGFDPETYDPRKRKGAGQ